MTRHRPLIIEPINNELPISAKEQIADRINTLKYYLAAKGSMDREQCRDMWNALDLLYDEVSYWL